MSVQDATPERCFPRLSAAYIDGRAHTARFRQQQFHRLHSVLVFNKSRLVEALQADNDYTELEAVFEFSLGLSELRSMYESVDLEAELAASRAVQSGQDGLQRKIGLGIVYIRPEKAKSSLYSILSPLCAALAAGNCVIVEVCMPCKKREEWFQDR